MKNLDNLPFSEVQELLKASDNAKTVKEGLAICRSFRDKYKLTEKEVLTIINRTF